MLSFLYSCFINLNSYMLDVRDLLNNPTIVNNNFAIIDLQH